MYKGIAKIVTNEGTKNVESGAWECKEMALAELRYFVGRELPIGASFKVFQNVVRV